jgi:hypothetical protein
VCSKKLHQLGVSQIAEPTSYSTVQSFFENRLVD